MLGSALMGVAGAFLTLSAFNAWVIIKGLETLRLGLRSDTLFHFQSTRAQEGLP